MKIMKYKTQQILILNIRIYTNFKLKCFSRVLLNSDALGMETELALKETGSESGLSLMLK